MAGNVPPGAGDVSPTRPREPVVTRRYLPTTLEELGRWFEAGEVPRTERYFVPPEDSDLGEYAALMDAADASRDLPDGDGRRMVLVVDTEGVAVDDAIAWRKVSALHIDVESGADPDEELAWYATQEIGPLLHP